MKNFLKVDIPKDRIWGLDLLRAVAILFVVYGHGTAIFKDPKVREILSFPVLDGVSMFFVLSGFLIGKILIKTISIKPISIAVLLEFWKRRWFRTIPNYLLLLTLLFFIRENIDFTLFIKYFFFIQNLNSPHPTFFPEAWSLAVEEWFYFLAPLCLYICLKTGVKVQQSLLLLIISVIVSSICIRYFKFYSFDIETSHAWDSLLRKQVICRMDSIMYGILGAYLNYYHGSIWLRHKKACFFLGISFLLFYKIASISRSFLGLEFNIYFCVYSFTVSSLGSFLLLPYLSVLKSGSGKMHKIITKISLISYSMYLTNLSLVQWYIIPKLNHSIPFPSDSISAQIYKYFMFWSLTILLSIIIFKYYEMPITKLREKRFF